jgi:epoxide hydrolase-like predicted phosphatase
MTKNKNKNIKAIVFDFGGVIELNEGGNLTKSIAELIGVPFKEFRRVYFKYNHLSHVENMGWEDMVVKVVATFDTSSETECKVRSLVCGYSQKRKINTELLALFPVLKKLGLKVGILSNSTSDLRQRLHEEKIIDMVDEVIISAEIGFQKPDKEAFRVAFEKLHIKPEEMVFVDDTVKSLEKSAEIGYVPILFKNNEQLKSDLRNIGIPLP